MASNLFARFRALIPAQPLQVGTVIELTATGAVVQLPGGAVITVRGAATLGGDVFVQGGVIQGDAPSLPDVTAEI